MAFLGLVKDKPTPEPVATSPVAPQPTAPPIGPYNPANGTFGTPAPPAATAGVTPEDAFSEPKILDKLRAALAQAQLPSGVDFYLYWQSLQSLQTLIADEPTRYKAAMGTLAAQGARVENILATTAHYLQVLDGKESSFDEFLKQRHATEVEAKIAEADSTKATIQAKADQIAQLSKDIQELQNAELTARNAATMAEAQLNANRTTFQTVKGRLANEIAMVRDRLATYCGTVTETK